MRAARGGSIERTKPTAGHGEKISKRLIITTIAALAATSAAAGVQDVDLMNPNTGNTVAVGTTDGSSLVLKNPRTGNTIAHGIISGSSVTLTNPNTGNAVAEGTIVGTSITLTDPNTGNTVAEGVLDHDIDDDEDD